MPVAVYSVNAECRNDRGQTLLSIATQRDDETLVRFLLTHWREVAGEDYSSSTTDRGGVQLSDLPVESRVFYSNPNSRDAKGWTCVCIAIFHDSRRALRLLLDHGGDPSIRSSYNKNAWDLAKVSLRHSHCPLQVTHDHKRTGSHVWYSCPPG